MASPRQIEANRRNAQRSTGPKTVGGKAKSSRNALRHGLARSCELENPEPPNFLFSISSGLEGEVGPEAAAAVAQAKRDMWCVRMVRQAILADLSDCLVVETMRRLNGLERYERGTLAMQRRRALQSLRRGRLSLRTAIGFVLEKISTACRARVHGGPLSLADTTPLEKVASVLIEH